MSKKKKSRDRALARALLDACSLQNVHGVLLSSPVICSL